MIGEDVVETADALSRVAELERARHKTCCCDCTHFIEVACFFGFCRFDAASELGRLPRLKDVFAYIDNEENVVSGLDECRNGMFANPSDHVCGDCDKYVPISNLSGVCAGYGVDRAVVEYNEDSCGREVSR